MEDIEDLVLSEDYWESNTRLQRDTIMPRVRRRKKLSNTALAEQLTNGSCNDGQETCSGAAHNNCCQKENANDSTINCCKDNGYTNADLKDNCKGNDCECSSVNKTTERRKKDNSSCNNNIGNTGCIDNEKDDNFDSKNNKQTAGKIVSSSGTSSMKCGINAGTAGSSNIPGLARIYVRTWGCAHNSSDSEYMMGQLAAYGYDIVGSGEEADLWLLNSCTVKSPAEHHLRNEITAAIGVGKKVVVAGCVSQGAPRSEFLAGLSIVGVQQIDRVVEVVEETLKGNSVRLLGTKKVGKKKQGGASLQLPKIRRNPLIEIISINTGCLNQCTYCKTKHARGELASYPIEDLVSRAEQSFNEGVVEIWLTSEDTGAYGRDIGATLPQLLHKLVDVIPPGCKLRLGMTNPPYILDHLKEMGEILQHPRVYRFLHVPVQSGSDSVLLDMKREYTREEFCTVVDTLRQSVPGITIATDIICGYPTETEDDFQDTMSLCQQYRFPSLFINQYFPRPGTPAARLQRIDSKQVKLRTKELSDFFQSYTPYDHKLGERQSILVTEESHDKKHWVGHNDYYEQVLVPKEQDYLGKTLLVEIMETGKHFLKGRVVDTTALASPALAAPLPQGAVSGGATKATEARPNKAELAKQETYILISFIVIIAALIAKLVWVCWRFTTAL